MWVPELNNVVQSDTGLVCLVVILQLLRNIPLHGYIEDAAWALCLWNFYVYEISMSIWCEKAFQRFTNFSPIIPVLVSVFSLLVLPVPTLNFSIQVEENKSPVTMKKLEYSRNQSWKKVKALCIYITSLYSLWSNKEDIFIVIVGGLIYDLLRFLIRSPAEKYGVDTFTIRRLSLITEHFSNIFVVLFSWNVVVN